MKRTILWASSALLFTALGQLPAQEKDKDGWVTLFNGKDTAGWKLKSDKYTVTKFLDETGQVIAGAKEAKLDQTLTVVDAKGKPIVGAKVNKVDGKDMPVDADGKVLPNAKLSKTGGRTAIVDAKGKELTAARKVTETIPNATGGWEVVDGVLTCGLGPKGVDLFTEQKFQDFELHVEFLGTSNSGVYLQGRYEIQIDNSFKVKPKLVEKNGKKVEELPNTMCGALYGQIPPSKNMAKPPTEWQTFDITFRAPRGEKGKEKARVTVVWNGAKVIDNAEIPNGTALDAGPILLQGDHGKVSFRNIKIKPIQLGEVKGTVMLDGKPLPEGAISFAPVEGKGASTHVLINDGKYSALVPVGAMKVSINVAKVVGKKKLYDTPGSPERPFVVELLPSRYNEKTVLRIEVAPGRNVSNFELTSK